MESGPLSLPHVVADESYRDGGPACLHIYVVLLIRFVGREEPGPFSTTCRIIGKVDPAACLHLRAVADWIMICMNTGLN